MGCITLEIRVEVLSYPSSCDLKITKSKSKINLKSSGTKILKYLGPSFLKKGSSAISHGDPCGPHLQISYS